jgi:uncharacterized protein involved in outer membrane biogenesis
MRRALLTIIGAVALILAAFAGAVLLAESEWAERRLEDKLSAMLGRAINLEGIDVRFAWPPRVELAALRIDNPDWAHREHLLDASELALTIEFWPLLGGRLVLDRLAAVRLAAGLERDDAHATWQFGRRADSKTDGQPRFEVQELHVRDAFIHYRNDSEDTALDIRARGTAGGGGGPATAQASGRYRGESAEARITAPSLLLSADQAIEVSFEARVGRTHGSGNAIVRASTSGLKRVDGEFRLSGPSFAALNNILPIHLPDTPPYQLAGTLLHEPGTWSFKDFSGQVGDSDLRGRWSYETAGARPMVRAELRSALLDVDDLLPIVGGPPAIGAGETAAPHQKREAKRLESAGKVIPRLPWHADRWGGVDADVKYEAAKILNAPRVPVEWLRVHAVVEEGVLRLAPVSIGVASGRVEGSASLDSRPEPLEARLELDARSIELRSLFPPVRSSAPALGTLYGRIRLEGEGGSLAGLLGTSNGDITLLVEGGALSALLIEAIGLDAGEALALLGTKEKERVPLNCAVMDFAVNGGTAVAQSFVVDTSDTLIAVSGSVDLDAERLDLVIRPQPRDASLLAARTPIVVSGTLRDPDVQPEAGPLAARAVAAGLLAAINPLLALLPLIEPGTGPENRCASLLEQARRTGAR